MCCGLAEWTHLDCWHYLHTLFVPLCEQVPGNFHVSTHSATAQPQSPDMTHTIHKLAFGEKLQVVDGKT